MKAQHYMRAQHTAFALPTGYLRSGGRLNSGQPCGDQTLEHFLWAALDFCPVRRVLNRTTSPGKPLRVACSLKMSVVAATVFVWNTAFTVKKISDRLLRHISYTQALSGMSGTE